METYTFDQLDERAQLAAVARYEDTEEMKSKILDVALTYRYREGVRIERLALSLMGWRFNEHGERIA